jgi:hypothetical protein
MSTSPSFCGMCDNAIFLSPQKFGVEIVKKDFVKNALNITVQGSCHEVIPRYP